MKGYLLMYLFQAPLLKEAKAVGCVSKSVKMIPIGTTGPFFVEGLYLGLFDWDVQCYFDGELCQLSIGEFSDAVGYPEEYIKEGVARNVMRRAENAWRWWYGSSEGNGSGLEVADASRS